MTSAPRRWLTLSVARPERPDDAALAAEALLALGGRAVAEVDGRLETHVPEPGDPDAFLCRAREALGLPGDAGPPDLRWSWQAHEDWAESWKRGLGPRRVTGRLLVTPGWCRPASTDAEHVLVLDPGMAFGTAEHGTTRGCLRLLDRVVRSGDRVLDVGAGSGILSVAALLLGAAEAVALDGDPWATAAIRENASANGVADRLVVEERWAVAADLERLGGRDLVLANIEAGRLTPLLDGLVAAAAPGGHLVLGGVLDHEWEAFAAEMERRGPACEAVDADGEWRSGLFRRPASP